MKAEVKGLPKKYAGYGFTGLVENKENKHFIAMAKDYLAGKATKKSLVFCGGVGNGKTRIAVSILRNLKPIERKEVISSWITETGREEKSMTYKDSAKSNFIIADEFFQRCNEATANYQSKMDYINNLLAYDVLCLDDLGVENISPAKQENLYLLINQAYVEERTIFLTTNFYLEELEKIDPRITDRLKEMALILKFEGKSFR